MTVYFIGAGPGAPDLLTVRALTLIRQAPVILYAGSLIPAEILAEARPDAEITDTALLNLDQIVDLIAAAHQRGYDVARLHSGDLALYSAMGEQVRRLKGLGIPYQVCPGVPSFAAAAARLGLELTLPGVSQTVVLTRTAVRSTAVPSSEDLTILAQCRALMVLHLSIGNLAAVVKKLTPQYGSACPVAVVYRATWPDEDIVVGTLADIEARVHSAGFIRTALVFVGWALAEDGFCESHLYDPERDRGSGPPPGRHPG